MKRLLPVLLLFTFACWSPEKSTDGPKTQLERLNALYIELEQKHTRSQERFGFSLEYAIEPPNTIAIVLRYDPMSDKALLAKDVADKARGFVQGLAAEKYQLPGLNVRSENIRLNVDK